MTRHDHGGGVIPPSNDASKKTDTKILSVSQKSKDALKPLFTEYLAMKDALTNDNLNEAKAAGTKVLKAVDGVNMSLFTGEAHGVWMGLSSDLENTLKHVQHFNTLEEIRKLFQQVSKSMIDLETSFNPNDETLYVLQCPMANNNKGADWPSTIKEVKSPYYGQSMLTCEEVTKEIK